MKTYNDQDNIPVNQSEVQSLADIIEVRLSRREAMKRFALIPLAAPFAGAILNNAVQAETKRDVSSLSFQEVDYGCDVTHHVAEGYDAQILIKWGDPIHETSKPFDVRAINAENQLHQFGYNNDYIAFIPQSETRGYLCVNHEYPSTHLMQPNIDKGKRENVNLEITKLEQAALGVSVLEVYQDATHKWHVDLKSNKARRIHAGTEMVIQGPAAGHERLQTSADTTGTKVYGTLGNCAGGVTPWGTYLTAEENFNGFFTGKPIEGHREATNHKRYDFKNKPYQDWGNYEARFDIEKEPNEPNRFGWIVEIDPTDPQSKPIKHTALGRFKHEGAALHQLPDGRVVVYSGDDQQFEYVYKFLSKGKISKNREKNKTLLDEGTLFVAKFYENGTLEWLPLIYGKGPLTKENGFHSQADVLIETRRAADLIEATPMDRPEDVETNTKTGLVYVMLTNNSKRKAEQIDAANPRDKNTFGHIIELIPPQKEGHGANTYRWNVLLRCGNPKDPTHQAICHPDASSEAWLASPDNCAFDNKGRIWISTDQGNDWHKSHNADGLWAADLEGMGRGLTKLFFRAPIGAEVTGPCFTPDYKTLFISVQHPGDDGTEEFAGFHRPSTFNDPATRWPDFDENTPPRPAIVAITKKDGGVIG